jgi:hypothetical protein
VLSFDPYDNNHYNDELEHVKAYKCLRQGLRAFEINGRNLEQIQKPLGSRDWILAQQILKEQQQLVNQGQQEELLISEVETDIDKDSGDEGSNNDNDDRIFFNLH